MSINVCRYETNLDKLLLILSPLTPLPDHDAVVYILTAASCTYLMILLKGQPEIMVFFGNANKRLTIVRKGVLL